jgi:hypothetical protein
MTIVVRCSLIGPMDMQLRMHSFFLSQECVHCSAQSEHRNAIMAAAGEQRLDGGWVQGNNPFALGNHEQQNGGMGRNQAWRRRLYSVSWEWKPCARRLPAGPASVWPPPRRKLSLVARPPRPRCALAQLRAQKPPVVTASRRRTPPA